MAEFINSIKQMPYSLEAEQALLGAIIIDPSKVDDAINLKEEEFYLEQHRQIFNVIKSLYIQNKAIDIVMLVSRITSAFELKDYDVSKYIKLICELGAANSNVVEYVNIIQDKYILRSLIKASGEISEKAYSETEEVKNVVDFAEQQIFEIINREYDTMFTPISDILVENYNTFQTLAKNKNDPGGVKTAFAELDRYFVSLGEGDLVIVGARPGVGKTSFCLNIAANVAKNNPDDEIAIFSLEMSKEQLVNRMLSSEAMIDNYTVRMASFSNEEWSAIGEASSRLSCTKILIDDTSNIKTTEMKSKLRRLKNLKLVIIDYLQLMQSEKKTDNRVLEIADITRSLKLIAKDLKIPIILCAQLSRAPKGATEKRPLLSDLRDSGAIEQDADIVMLLYKENYNDNSNTDINSEQESIECIISKNRHGSTGTVKFAWYGQYFKYVAIEEKFNENG